MTRYGVRYRVDVTGIEHSEVFDSATERALRLILLSPYIVVLKEWLQAEHPAGGTEVSHG